MTCYLKNIFILFHCAYVRAAQLCAIALRSRALAASFVPGSEVSSVAARSSSRKQWVFERAMRRRLRQKERERSRGARPWTRRGRTWPGSARLVRHSPLPKLHFCRYRTFGTKKYCTLVLWLKMDEYSIRLYWSSVLATLRTLFTYTVKWLFNTLR
jgi:hypothetical protein